MKKLNNTVIKNLSPQMGMRIIEKYQSDGWDTGENTGNNYYGMDTDPFWEGFYYYGVIDGKFSGFNSKWIESDRNNYVLIIELDEWRLNGVSDIGICQANGLSEEDRIAVRSVVLAQALVSELDMMSGTSPNRDVLKIIGNAFVSELDGLLDNVYGEHTDSSICYLVDRCQSSLNDVFDALIKSDTLSFEK
jgi:hypothetical protein